MAALELGFRSTVTPIPPIEANTHRVPAGAVTLALEHRQLTAEIIRDTFADAPEQLQEVERVQAPELFDDQGFSVHVFASASGKEILRFDMFDDDPHYHYIHPGIDNIVVAFDANANGPMWDWTIQCLRRRLGQMLEYAGRPELAGALDPELIALGVSELERVKHGISTAVR